MAGTWFPRTWEGNLKGAFLQGENLNYALGTPTLLGDPPISPSVNCPPYFHQETETMVPGALADILPMGPRHITKVTG